MNQAPFDSTIFGSFGAAADPPLPIGALRRLISESNHPDRALTISQTHILLANNSSNVLFSSDSPRRNLFAEREYDPDLARVLPGSVPVACIFFLATFDFVFLFLSI